jgi:hypothetical protein
MREDSGTRGKERLEEGCSQEVVDEDGSAMPIGHVNWMTIADAAGEVESQGAEPGCEPRSLRL